MKLQKQSTIAILFCIFGLSEAIVTFTNLPLNSSVLAEVNKTVKGVNEAIQECGKRDAILAPLSNRPFKLALIEQFKQNPGKQALVKTAF